MLYFFWIYFGKKKWPRVKVFSVLDLKKKVYGFYSFEIFTSLSNQIPSKSIVKDIQPVVKFIAIK